MGRKIRYFRNGTTDSRLVAGKLYTMNELAKLVNFSPSTLRNRVGAGDTVTDEHFISRKRVHVIWPVFETDAEATSAEWLRRAL
jgi:hypothetical protein